MLFEPIFSINIYVGEKWEENGDVKSDRKTDINFPSCLDKYCYCRCDVSARLAVALVGWGWHVKIMENDQN
jgi:hypothetical protein